MNHSSYNFWFRKGIAKKGTYFCQQCGQLSEGKGNPTIKMIDDEELQINICDVCLTLAGLNGENRSIVLYA